jgi:hypothetical protein
MVQKWRRAVLAAVAASIAGFLALAALYRRLQRSPASVEVPIRNELSTAPLSLITRR